MLFIAMEFFFLTYMQQSVYSFRLKSVVHVFKLDQLAMFNNA